jgi:hypothetical protein
MTPSGIEPATLRFVAQYLNQRPTAVPTLDIPTPIYGEQTVTVLPIHLSLELYRSTTFDLLS